MLVTRGGGLTRCQILIKKSPQWCACAPLRALSTNADTDRYALPPTKRASIYKAQTRFNQIAGIMLPRATRRLYRCDAGAEFDFAVWMDYVASNERAVLSTMDILATSPECVVHCVCMANAQICRWDYVEREVRVMLEVGSTVAS